MQQTQNSVDDEFDQDELDEDEPDEDFEENDGFESEEAAVENYRQALRKLNVRKLDIQAEVEGWRQHLRKLNARLRQRRQLT